MGYASKLLVILCFTLALVHYHSYSSSSGPALAHVTLVLALLSLSASWLRISLANIHLVRRSQSAFWLVIPLFRAYSWFLVFKHIESLVPQTGLWNFSPTYSAHPNLSPISFLIILLSAKQLCLSTRTYGFTYFRACSLSVNTSTSPC